MSCLKQSGSWLKLGGSQGETAVMEVAERILLYQAGDVSSVKQDVHLDRLA